MKFRHFWKIEPPWIFDVPQLKLGLLWKKIYPAPPLGNFSQIFPFLFFMMAPLKGESKKTSLNLHRSFCLISLVTNILEDWDIIHLKGEIHISVWSTKTFLYDIRELRYGQNNTGYQISRIWNNDHSNFFESDTAKIYA